MRSRWVARILLVAEAYLAMVFGRRYHDRDATSTRWRSCEQGIGTRYDREVVAALTATIEGTARPARRSRAAD